MGEVEELEEGENAFPPRINTMRVQPNNGVNQQVRNEMAELRRLVLQGIQPAARPQFRVTYQKPYPAYIDEQNPFPLNFKMPNFPTFSGEDSSISSRDHIYKFSSYCVAFEDNPNYKLRLFGNSLVGMASQWYSLLSPNSITNWGQMESAFHEQFYRMEPEVTINDLVEVKQYEHESTEDFIMRFKKTKMRCQFPINNRQLISIAQKALRLPLRKKFYDVQFHELQELVIAATKYEKLLAEEQQLKHSSKIPFYKSKVPIHQVEFEEMNSERKERDTDGDVEVCAAELTTPFKPIVVKGLVKPVKDQKVVMNDGGFVPVKPPKYQSYSFDLSKASDIYEELVRARVIRPDQSVKMPKPEELRGKKYCKIHYTFNHSIANCVQFRDWVQDMIVKEKLLIEKPQATMMIDADPFPEAPVHMVNLRWPENGKRKFVVDIGGEKKEMKLDRPTEEKPKAAIIKGRVLCSRCQCECELEIPPSGTVLDQELRRRDEEKVKKVTAQKLRRRHGRFCQILVWQKQISTIPESKHYNVLEQIRTAALPR